MAVSNFTRIVSFTKSLKDNFFTRADFGSCIFHQLALNEEEEEGRVGCFLQDNKFHIYPINQDEDEPGYILKHPSYCPLKEVTRQSDIKISEELTGRGVDVAVAIITESVDGLILLTRRAKHMRTFPGLWVPAGGHIEKDESLLDAGLRELEEETGLHVSPDERENSSILGLWESAYPAWLGLGPPRRHHIVVYMHVPLKGVSSSYRSSIKLNPEEVDACAWVNKQIIESVVSGTPLPKKSSVSFISVNIHGEHADGDVDMTFLADKLNVGGHMSTSSERVSTGSRYALGLWLRLKGLSPPPEDGINSNL